MRGNFGADNLVYIIYAGSCTTTISAGVVLKRGKGNWGKGHAYT